MAQDLATSASSSSDFEDADKVAALLAAARRDFRQAKETLRALNDYLQQKTPLEILRWSLRNVPRIVQTSSLGPSGLVILDNLVHLHQLERLSLQAAATAADGDSDSNSSTARGEGASGKSEQTLAVPVVFIDTLHHFPETLELVAAVERHYASVGLRIWTVSPSLRALQDTEDDSINHESSSSSLTTRDGKVARLLHPELLAPITLEQFNRQFGTNMWETDPATYDFLVKAEPGRRALDAFGAEAYITGRRRSQKGERGELDIIEIETSPPHRIKINPVAFWSGSQVWAYIRANDLPYNSLHDRGYRSVGDWHSTKPSDASNGDASTSSSAAEGAAAAAVASNDSADSSERAGRWAGSEKSECGLHKDFFAMKAAANLRKKQLAATAAASSSAAPSTNS